MLLIFFPMWISIPGILPLQKSVRVHSLENNSRSVVLNPEQTVKTPHDADQNYTDNEDDEVERFTKLETIPE